MKKYIKKISIFLLLVLLLQLVPVVSIATDLDTSKRIPRVVSVVFDNSGSMYSNGRGTSNDRWAYASYALQAFAGMMSAEDKLYVTYINSGTTQSNSVPKTYEINLSTPSKKQSEIDSFEKIQFGGKTPNAVQNAADMLTKAYSSYRENANYYLVVMSDGVLDPDKDGKDVSFENVLGTICPATESKLSGAEFGAYFFSMIEFKKTINGVNVIETTDSTKIASALTKVANAVTGRTDITKDTTKQGGKISFTLDYPAYSVALMVQKENGNFQNVKPSLTKDGVLTDYKSDTFYIETPLTMVKHPEKSFDIGSPKKPDPIQGFVSLFNNGDSVISKGSYSIDLSAYGISSTDNVSVLVEPAVKLGTKYYLGETGPYEFEDVKDNLKEGDVLEIEFGLFEINPDGSLGEKIKEGVLDPDYNVTVNGKKVDLDESGKSAKIKITKEMDGGELKIQAEIKGYQPIVKRGRFGIVFVLPTWNIDDPSFKNEILLTKPEWKKWNDGQGEIVFTASNLSDQMLDLLYIDVEGTDAIAEGKCSTLSENIKIYNNKIIYTPKIENGKSFSELTDFTVTIHEEGKKEEGLSVKVKVVQPVYKFKIENPFGNKNISWAEIKNNEKAISFILTADYKNDGNFVSVSNYDCENDLQMSLSFVGLTGDEVIENGKASFVVKYKADSPTLSGDSHNVSAKAVVDGKEILSDLINLSLVDYSIIVNNAIEADFLTLDTLKKNEQKIVFTIRADYDGDGNFEDLRSSEEDIYDALDIECGAFEKSGTYTSSIIIEKNGGKTEGKSFTPRYDEFDVNNSADLVFTEIAGVTHRIIASLGMFGATAETSFSVKAPNYTITVLKSSLYIMETDLRYNEDTIEFSVFRDGRQLTKRELEKLNYTISHSYDGKRFLVEESISESNGVGIISCKPSYRGVKIFGYLHDALIDNGETEIYLDVVTDKQSGSVYISVNPIANIIGIIICAIIIIVLYIWICFITREKFAKGTMYAVSFKEDIYGGKVLVDVQWSRPNSWKKFFSSSFMRPRATQKWSMGVNSAQGYDSLKFKTTRSGGAPEWVFPKDIEEKYMRASCSIPQSNEELNMMIPGVTIGITISTVSNAPLFTDSDVADVSMASYNIVSQIPAVTYGEDVVRTVVFFRPD